MENQPLLPVLSPLSQYTNLFNNFVPSAAYPGYSADFFDGRHFVMKGASPATALPLIRRSWRNWFQPHYPYPYAAFRLVHE